MNHGQLIDFFGSTTKAAASLGVQKSTISKFKPGASQFSRLDSPHQLRAMNLSGGILVPDETALELAKNIFPCGVSSSPLAALLDKTA